MVLLQQIINGLALGGIYALIAIGWTTVFGIVGVMNWTHGEVYMLGGFTGFFLFTLLKLSFLPALLIAMVVGAFIAMAIDEFGYHPLRRIGMPKMAGFVTALGLSTFLRYSSTSIFTPDPRAYPQVLQFKNITLATINGTSLTISSLHLSILFSTLVIMVLLELFIKRTIIGKAMLAASQDMSTLGLMGADSEILIKITFAISGALGAAAGVFVGTLYAIDTMMGSLAGLKGWAVAILGGIGSITGSMIGGLMLGVAENITSGFISTGYKDAIGFIIMIIVLIVKPTGFLGFKFEEKV